MRANDDAPICRPMQAADIPVVAKISAKALPDYPEGEFVFAERLRLFPQGCFVVEGSEILGYAISYPWVHGAPPRLNTALGALPAQPTTYYIHDIALRPAAHGRGLARTLIEKVVATAKAEGFRHLSLVSVNGSAAFWTSQGFTPTLTPSGYAGGVTMERDI